LKQALTLLSSTQISNTQVEEGKMADSFKDREKGFEAKYQHDQEMLFKITARRNKLLGLWAAEIMGISGDDAEIYANEVVASDFEEVGDADVVRKVLGDLSQAGSEITETELRKRMNILGDGARQQIEDELL
tara:strand:- start:1086 stop:1481 length:396 start_codon:yes stop_codon:yes gene_type:complete